jgi:signal transduction histidine kinase/ActR/RegA family two-component response regulator
MDVHMNIPLTQRLSFKQARLTVLLTFVLGTLLSLIQVAMDYASENASINREIAALLEISHQPAARIAYNIDSELAQELVTGLLRSPAVLSAQMLDNNGAQLAGASRTFQPNKYRFLSDYLFGERRVFEQPLQVNYNNTEQLGLLRLEVDTYVYGSNFLRRAAMTMAGGLARTLVLSVCLLVLFWFMLTKPLKGVINAISRRNLSMISHPDLPCPPGHESDEIGVLVNVTNRHLASISEQMRQRREAEERLTRYLNELESIVSARTLALEAANAHLLRSNEELQQARSEALQQAQARSAFLANMSHEIRTPLNGLLGMLELSLDGPLTEQQRQQLSTASSAGSYLMTLLNDVLDLSKFESGRLELEQIPFDLGALVEETASLLSPNANSAVTLSCLIDPQLPAQVLGDPTRVRQIISNLLSNALKFTRSGRVDVEASALANGVRLTVRDTGIGIAEPLQARIFHPFAQADAGIAREFGGTGLGLALIRRLTDAMAGRLSLQSTVGEGSLFQIDLPLPAHAAAPCPLPLHGKVLLLGKLSGGLTELLQRQLPAWGIAYQQLAAEPESFDTQAQVLILDDPSSLQRLRGHCPQQALLLITRWNDLLTPERLQALAPAEQLAAPVARADLYQALRRLLDASAGENSSQAQATAAQRPARVLLVEDNPVNQMVARGMLEKLGCQVASASDGSEALDYLEGNEVDLVLMDCNMPNMDGYEATRRVRLQPQLRHLPVVALTANVLTDERTRCVAAGMNDYLAKPFSRSALGQLLERWLPTSCALNEDA